MGEVTAVGSKGGGRLCNGLQFKELKIRIQWLSSWRHKNAKAEKGQCPTVQSEGNRVVHIPRNLHSHWWHGSKAVQQWDQARWSE